MSAHHDPNSSINEDVTFEPTDVATRPIVLSVALLAVFTVVFTGAGHLVYFGLAERERANSPEPSPLAEQYAAKAPPEPRLQVHPKTDLDVMHAAEDKILFGWGWQDKEKGIAHVPIERAMQMIVAKNLPARQGPVPWKMAPQGTAPRQPAEAAGAPDWQSGSYYSGGHHAAGAAHDDHAGKAAGHAPAQGHAAPAGAHDGHGH